jgi:hypothetical protein
VVLLVVGAAVVLVVDVEAGTDDEVDELVVVDVELVVLLDVELDVLLVVGGIVLLVVDVEAGAVELDVLAGADVVLVLLELLEVDDEVLVELVLLLDVEDVELVVVVVVVARHAPVRTSSRHWLNVPPSASKSSEMVSVQTPFGSSPTNAASGSSGTSGVAGPLGPQALSVTSPLLAV